MLCIINGTIIGVQLVLLSLNNTKKGTRIDNNWCMIGTRTDK